MPNRSPADPGSPNAGSPEPPPGSDALDPDTRRPWVTPVVEELPRLTDLTLATTAPVSGSISNDAGILSTVF
jgi:hypothetical protein